MGRGDGQRAFDRGNARPADPLGSLLCNCSSVSTPYPLTNSPEAIDKEKFEGSWIFDDKGQVLQVKFDDKNVAHIAGLQWENDDFEIGKMEMVLIEGNDHKFMSLRAEEEGEWLEEYYFYQYKFTDQGDLILWPPNMEGFEHAIEQGLLNGGIKKGKYSTSIAITSDASILLKVLNGPDNSKLLDYKNPTILKKTASPKN